MFIDTDLVANLLIRTAEKELLPRYAEVAGRTKTDGTLVTDADLHAQEAISAGLKESWPDIPCLSEEMKGPSQRAILSESDLFWCLDPLDGTSNFASGLPFFGISLSLVKRGVPEFGMVYDPVRGDIYSATRGGGASRNGRPMRSASGGKRLEESMAIVDFKRLPPRLATEIAVRPPFRSQRNCGSVALEWCWLASGRFQLYLHGGQRLWDYAAGCLIFQEVGGHSEIARGFGAPPVEHFDLDPVTVVAAVDRQLFRDWRDWIAKNSGGRSHQAGGFQRSETLS